MSLSYPKIYNLGHPALHALFEGDVVVEEKVDGSQIAFGKLDGELIVRSKNNTLFVDAPDKMFAKAVPEIQGIESLLTPGWLYRGEYLRQPKHNALAYARTPRHHIVIFDISTGPEQYLRPPDKHYEAARLGFETVPLLYAGPPSHVDYVELLAGESFLGGVNMEGVVIKNYGQFGRDGHVLLGKLVSTEFREIHNKEWKKDNPAKRDVLFALCESYRTEARWRKAVQTMRDEGTLWNEPKDIGHLIRLVQEDVKAECIPDITQRLLKWAVPHILRASTKGFPEWYKDHLTKLAETDSSTSLSPSTPLSEQSTS